MAVKPLELFPPRLKPSYRRTHFSRGACGFVVARSVRWLDQDPAQVGGDYCEKIRPLRGRLAWLATLYQVLNHSGVESYNFNHFRELEYGT